MMENILFNISSQIGKLEMDNLKLEKEVLSNRTRRSTDPNVSPFEDTILLTPDGSESKRLIDAMRDIGRSMGLGLEEYWSQIHEPLESTDLHYHGDSKNQIMLSWVYYVKVPSNSGDLQFILDDKDYRAPTHIHKTVAGDYIIFPSWIRHKVSKNLSHDYRISIAGDFSLDGIK